MDDGQAAFWINDFACTAMLTHVEFRSDRFPPYEGEEKEVNPSSWGKRLAEFLHENLAAEGFQTERPFSEDWG